MTDTRYVTIAVTAYTRDVINAYTAWATGVAGRKLSNSEAIVKALNVARQHPEEVHAASALTD